MLALYRNCLKKKQLQDMDIEFEKEMIRNKKRRKQVAEENNNNVKESRFLTATTCTFWKSRYNMSFKQKCL